MELMYSVLSPSVEMVMSIKKQILLNNVMTIILIPMMTATIVIILSVETA